MNVKRILIIDDEYRIQEVTKLVLEMVAEWNVLTASSGEEGISVAEVEQPDAILLDMMMPILDGTATLAKLKDNNATRNIPVILLTAKVQAPTDFQFTELGAVAVIYKPFDPLKLAENIAINLGWQI